MHFSSQNEYSHSRVNFKQAEMLRMTKYQIRCGPLR